MVAKAGMGPLKKTGKMMGMRGGGRCGGGGVGDGDGNGDGNGNGDGEEGNGMGRKKRRRGGFQAGGAVGMTVEGEEHGKAGKGVVPGKCGVRFNPVVRVRQYSG